jgi:hypothetical protein
MSAWLKDSKFPTTRSGKLYLSVEEVERIEKSLYKLSPDIIRYNKQKAEEERKQPFGIPTFKKNLKKKQREKIKEILSPLTETIHWLDYPELGK